MISSFPALRAAAPSVPSAGDPKKISTFFRILDQKRRKKVLYRIDRIAAAVSPPAESVPGDLPERRRFSEREGEKSPVLRKREWEELLFLLRAGGAPYP